MTNTKKLTLFDSKAVGPFLKSDVLVLVSITMLKEAGGAVLHRDERGTQRGQFSVGQEPDRAHENANNKVVFVKNCKSIKCHKLTNSNRVFLTVVNLNVIYCLEVNMNLDT